MSKSNKDIKEKDDGKGQLRQSKSDVRQMVVDGDKVLPGNKRPFKEISSTLPETEPVPLKATKTMTRVMKDFIRAVKSPYNCSLCAQPGNRQAFITQQIKERKRIPELICHSCKEKIIDFELLHSREMLCTERSWFLTFNKYWFLETNKKASIKL